MLSINLKIWSLYVIYKILPIGNTYWAKPRAVGSSVVKNPSANARGADLIPGLGKTSLEKGMATHSSILTWEIPWTEGPGGLQSTGSQRLRRDLETERKQKRSAWYIYCGLRTVLNKLYHPIQNCPFLSHYCGFDWAIWTCSCSWAFFPQTPLYFFVLQHELNLTFY